MSIHLETPFMRGMDYSVHSAKMSSDRSPSQRSDFDFHGASDDAQKSTAVQASFTLFKVFVGSGILALPLNFFHVGLGLGVTGMFFSAILTYYCMSLMLRVVDDMRSTTPLNVQMVTKKILGKGGKLSVEISLIIMQIGIAIAILIFATKFLNYVVCGFGLTEYCDNYLMIGIAVALVVIPLSFINNMHYFYYPSLFATFFILANITQQFIYNFKNFGNISFSDVLQGLTTFHLEELPGFFGVATYAFEGIGVIFSVRSSMQRPDKFQNILRAQMFLITLLYTVFPATSELAYGEKTREIILFNLPITNHVCLSIQSLYVVAQLFGFPVQLHPVFHILETSKSCRGWFYDRKGQPKGALLKCAIRIILIVLMVTIALTTKSFNNFLNLLGSGVFVYLGYLLPIVLYHLHFKKRASKFFTAVNCVAFPISVVLGITGIYVSIKEMVNPSDS